MQDVEGPCTEDRCREGGDALDIFLLIRQLAAGDAADHRGLCAVRPELFHLVHDEPAALIGEHPALVHGHQVVLRCAPGNAEMMGDLCRGRRPVILDIEPADICIYFFH